MGSTVAMEENRDRVLTGFSCTCQGVAGFNGGHRTAGLRFDFNLSIHATGIFAVFVDASSTLCGLDESNAAIIVPFCESAVYAHLKGLT